MDKRNIGRIAEKEFSTWCSQVGITCNPSIEDDEAWDFIIEFGLDEKDFMTQDEVSPGIKSFIQVKASDSVNSNRNITLRNWQKMIKNSYPVFILRIEFDENKDPQRGYLIHIGSELISKGLKKLREIEDGMEFLLKRTMTYTIDDDSLLNTLDGNEIKSRIEKFIPNGINKYIQWKSNFVETIGYEEEELTFKIPLKKGVHPSEELQDLSLGLIPYLEVESAKTRKKRFGKYSKEISLGPGKLTMNIEPYSKATLVLRTDDFLDELDIELDLYKPKGINNLPKDKLKFVVKDKNLSLQISYKTKNIRLDFSLPDPKKETDLSEYKSSSSYLYMLSQAKNRGSDLLAEIMVDGVSILKFNPVINFQNEEYALLNARSIKLGLDIADYFKIPNYISDSDILIKQVKRLEFLKNLIEGNQGRIRLEFWSEDLLPDTKVGFAFPFGSIFGGFKLFQGIYVISKPELRSKKNKNRKDYLIESDNYGKTIKTYFKDNLPKKTENKKLLALEKASKSITDKKGIDEFIFLLN
ncbi:MAG: hypothetical protein JXR11_03370 [Balneola sp.]